MSGAKRPAPKAATFSLRVESRAPLSVVVSRQLREQIVSGMVTDGTELPSEKELSQKLGVGRSTVREALRILQAQGLLSGGDTVSTQRPRVSSEQSMATAADVMENVLRLGRVPLDDLVELRLVIEGAAVVQAAARAANAKEALAQAGESVLVMEAAYVDVETFRAADVAFHQAIAKAAGNAAYPLVMGVLREAISSHLGETLHKQKDTARSMATLAAEHAAILDAVTSGRSKRARALMESHIHDFYMARDRREQKTRRDRGPSVPEET